MSVKTLCSVLTEGIMARASYAELSTRKISSLPLNVE